MGPIALLNPWMLTALIALPLIWLILRMTPPRPRRIEFPPTRILLGLEDQEKTPSKTPWWLTALRMLLLALAIIALARPVLQPDARLTVQSGLPLLIVFDNGWDSATDFALRKEVASAAIGEASNDGRPVILAPTAELATWSLAATSGAEQTDRLAALEPRPYLADHAEFAKRLAENFAAGSAEVLWFAGTIDTGSTSQLAQTLGQIAADGTIITGDAPAYALRPPENAADGVRISVAGTGGAADIEIAGHDEKGRRIVAAPVTLSDNGTADVKIDLPVELRNSLTRFVVAGHEGAGAVQLLDSRWRRKTVGLIAGEIGGVAQPLLAPLTYVERALARRADILAPDSRTTASALKSLMERGVSVIVLTDTGTLLPDTATNLVAWMNAGGTLVRFASPSLADSAQSLLPVRLREGERALGGSLSWQEPQPIGRFSPDSPFASITVPDDVRINRQILADPQGLAEADVWAELADGTPLVTARTNGAGRVILFHVTADPRWSNLPISGAFVEMLAALVDSAQAVGPLSDDAGAASPSVLTRANSTLPWAPVNVLDGYGRLTPPAADATLIADIESIKPSAETPPGYYERASNLRALNAVDADTAIAALDASALPWSAAVRSLQPRQSTPLWPWALALAGLLAVLDGIAVLVLSGTLAGSLARRRTASGPAAALLVAGLLAFGPDPASAQSGSSEISDDDLTIALIATLKTRLAYVLTGNAGIDETSRAGLSGLTAYLTSRTAMEPGEPVGVDIERDELAFYPFLYWPVDADSPIPPANVMARIEAFMKNGGTILFDTRDADGALIPGAFSTSAETDRLRAILSFIDVPPLEPVPPDHVLTKAFYLLSEFPGRWDKSALWVEAIGATDGNPGRPARGGDGVSPIMISGNDFAAAWAIGSDGSYLYPTVPADPRQREFALRSGVNIVMYTMTGNYKADQVHV
ncbi:MAG: DUF4159 domain-containing protein, partial [Alphaproteobacteria bacterium]